MSPNNATLQFSISVPKLENISIDEQKTRNRSLRMAWRLRLASTAPGSANNQYRMLVSKNNNNVKVAERRAKRVDREEYEKLLSYVNKF